MLGVRVETFKKDNFFNMFVMLGCRLKFLFWDVILGLLVFLLFFLLLLFLKKVKIINVLMFGCVIVVVLLVGCVILVVLFYSCISWICNCVG